MLISICIPTYSRLNFLKQAVQSCLAQSYKNIEICISQDSKKDGPDLQIKMWCEEQVSKYPFLKYNLNKQNLGLAGNWNKVVEMANGEYLIIIGDDDILTPYFIESLAEKIQFHNADVAFSNQCFINEKGEILTEYTNTANKIYLRDKLISGVIPDPIKTVLNNSIPISSSLIKRAILKTIPFSTNLNTPEFEIFLKIALNGGIFFFDERKLAYFRIHEQSATASGLTIDKFLIKIIAIDLPQRYQQQKFNFISTKMIPAINRALRTGKKKIAKELLGSGYYPRNHLHHKLAQKILIQLPSWIVRRII